MRPETLFLSAITDINWSRPGVFAMATLVGVIFILMR